mgnify:CR=1 FL=1
MRRRLEQPEPSFRAFGQSIRPGGRLTVSSEQPAHRRQRQLFRLHGLRGSDRSKRIGHDASVGARGVMVATVIKTGGNDFHGAMFFGGTSSNFESAPKGGEGGNLSIREDINGEHRRQDHPGRAVVLVRHALPEERGQRSQLLQAGRLAVHPDQSERVLHAEAHLSDGPQQQVQRFHDVESPRRRRECQQPHRVGGSSITRPSEWKCSHKPRGQDRLDRRRGPVADARRTPCSRAATGTSPARSSATLTNCGKIRRRDRTTGAAAPG